MPLTINSITYDKYEGIIELPKLTATARVRQGVEWTGATIRPARPKPFTLRTTFHDAASNLELNQQIQRETIGQTVQLAADGTNYFIAPYRLQFLVLDVTTIEADLIPHAAGSRNGLPYNWTPASRVIVDWNLLAIPVVSEP